MAWQGVLTAPGAFADPFSTCLPWILELRSSTREEDILEMAIEIYISISQYQLGWISQNQGGQVGE